MNEKIYAIALSRLSGISLAAALQLYKYYGSAKAVFELKEPPEDLSPRIRKYLVNILTHSTEVIKRASVEYDFCTKKNIRIITFNDDDYPVLLKTCDDAPLVLFYKGEAQLNVPHIISVVGTRRITEYGKDICCNFCNDLQRLIPDALVVSGLAYGVDIHIHRNCLSNNIKTIGVLAHGLDRIYPSLHRNVAIEMIDNGGLLTEYLTQTQPKPENFVRRNRIVAGMSAATIVVESAEKGGALITARLAQDYNRSVFAFPGRITDQYSQGCNNLIRDNIAAVITSANDFVEMMGWQKIVNKNIQRQLFPDLSHEEQIICQLLSQNDRKQLNQLVVESGLSISIVTSLLFELELKGVVKPMPGGLYRLLK